MPAREIFNKWREVHAMAIRICYGGRQETQTMDFDIDDAKYSPGTVKDLTKSTIAIGNIFRNSSSQKPPAGGEKAVNYSGILFCRQPVTAE
ncbi:MAG: hypothetical protein U0519_04535 [Candidatus Gracilibacteria bacterium]